MKALPERLWYWFYLFKGAKNPMKPKVLSAEKAFALSFVTLFRAFHNFLCDAAAILMLTAGRRWAGFHF